VLRRSRVERASRVETRHHHHVIGFKLVEQPAKLHAVGLGSADMHVAENLPASGLGQLPRLRVNALALSARRYPCIPVFHGGNYAANLRSKKAQSFQRPNFAAKFLISAYAPHIVLAYTEIAQLPIPDSLFAQVGEDDLN
jgi:hypothetical protein